MAEKLSHEVGGNERVSVRISLTDADAAACRAATAVAERTDERHLQFLVREELCHVKPTGWFLRRGSTAVTNRGGRSSNRPE